MPSFTAFGVALGLPHHSADRATGLAEFFLRLSFRVVGLALEGRRVPEN